MLAEKSVIEFFQETASKNPVPGGGSIAASSGAAAAALVEMVASLTVGKSGYEDVEAEMIDVIQKVRKIRGQLIQDIDRDSEAFNKVMDAFGLPKGTDQEKRARIRAIQQNTKIAAQVPLEVAKKSFEIMDLSRLVVTKGNKNAITDGAVSAMMARTAVLSALYNVKINLGSIKDEKFVNGMVTDVETLEKEVIQKEKEILSLVQL